MGKQWKQFETLFSWAPKSLQTVTAAMKWRHLLLGKKAMANLHCILKCRDVTLLTKVHLVKAMVFPVVMYGCKRWTIKKGLALKNWCFGIAVLEKTLDSPLDCKEIKPVNPKGNKSWIFIGRTDAETESLILSPPDVKSYSLEKTLILGRIEGRRRRKRQRMRWLDGITNLLGMSLSSGSWWWQGSLACCSPWGHKELDTTEQMNNNNDLAHI